MSLNHKIQANTRYSFACIGLMLLAFLAFVVIMLVPLGLYGMNQIIAMRISLYAVLLFAVAGGIFSIRVAYFRKKAGKG